MLRRCAPCGQPQRSKYEKLIREVHEEKWKEVGVESGKQRAYTRSFSEKDRLSDKHLLNLLISRVIDE